MDSETIKNSLIDATRTIINMMGFKAEVEILENNLNGSILNMVSIKSDDDLGAVIGKNGQNISALEQIIRLVIYKKFPEGANFILDVNDYRKSKADFVLKQAKETAMRVKSTKKAEALLPMSSYERRLVHMELASHLDLATESIGEEPKRRVVIKPL